MNTKAQRHEGTKVPVEAPSIFLRVFVSLCFFKGLSVASLFLSGRVFSLERKKQRTFSCKGTGTTMNGGAG
jgi:hypothetical protein